MSKIIACYKWVADEADIKINADLSVDIKKAKGKISDYDKNAIEAAVQTASALGGQAVTLTFGTATAKQSLKDALSRGPEEGYWINAEAAGEADGSAPGYPWRKLTPKVPRGYCHLTIPLFWHITRQVPHSRQPA